jgi:hypothetical protein
MLKRDGKKKLWSPGQGYFTAGWIIRQHGRADSGPGQILRSQNDLINKNCMYIQFHMMQT